LLDHVTLLPIVQISEGTNFVWKGYTGLAICPFDEGAIQGKRRRELCNGKLAGNLQARVDKPSIAKPLSGEESDSSSDSDSSKEEDKRMKGLSTPQSTNNPLLGGMKMPKRNKEDERTPERNKQPNEQTPPGLDSPVSQEQIIKGELSEMELEGTQTGTNINLTRRSII
jgi:hypothetical protein